MTIRVELNPDTEARDYEKSRCKCCCIRRSDVKKFSGLIAGVADHEGTALYAVVNGEGSQLTGTLLAIFLRGVKPVLQNGERLGFDFEEGETAAKIGLHVDDF
jgi:hypothetical protein